MAQQTKNGFMAGLYMAFYQYILRVSPGVMVTDLRQEFKMTAEQFSSLGALYLYAYSLLQIPLGIAIDRIGVRRTVLMSMLLCIAGALSLGFAESLLSIQASRLLVGAGSACAFMAALKVAADWLPSGKRGFLMGATLTLGTIGALTAGRPQVWLIESLGWRTTVVISAAFGLLIFLLAFVTLHLPKDQKISIKRPFNVIAKNIGQIIRNKQVMIYAVLAIGVYTPLSVLADLWGTAFLMQKYSLTRADAAQTSMMMYVGLSVGSLILPYVCEKWQVLDLAIKICSLLLLLSFALILFGPVFDIYSLSVVLVLLGIFCSAEMMCFTGAVHYTTQENSGMTIGVVNTLNMFGGALLQQGIGYILDTEWNGKFDIYGVRVYDTQDFVVALSLLLAVIAFCVLISLRLKPIKN
jgi:MFS family permease